jgi:DNA-directed RNA polymerase subunit M/transcription elongation factor TFIIS
MVGEKMYCPVCYFEITVPAASTVKDIDESKLYAIDAEPVDVREMEERKKFISMRCRVCHTNIAVSKEQVGKILVCPECETKVRVPESALKKFKQSEENWNRISQTQDKQQFPITQQPDRDTYAISGDDSAKSEGKNIRVYCKLCGTMMYASEPQIGTEITCPDCETKNLVVAPRKSAIAAQFQTPPLPPVFEGGKSFGIAGKDSPLAVTGLLVPVVCSLCGTRMYAGESEIGGFKICPDCGTQNEIKSVPKKERIQPQIAQGDGYGVDKIDKNEKRPAIRTLTDYRYVEGSVDEELYNPEKAKSKLKSTKTSDPLPSEKTNSTTSTASPPTKSIARNRARRIDDDVQSPQLPRFPLFARIFVTFTCAMLWWRVLIGLFSMIFLVGFIWLADTFYTVFLFTFVGKDLPDKEDWNDFRPVEYGLIFFWLIFLVFVSSLPGFVAVYLIDLPPVQTPMNMIAVSIISAFFAQVSIVVFFPILFLSTIESNSPFLFFSKTIYGSLITCFEYWFLFYIWSFLLFAMFIFFPIWSKHYLLLSDAFGSILTIIFWTILLILYARLLGRLGWIIEERSNNSSKKKRR